MPEKKKMEQTDWEGDRSSGPWFDQGLLKMNWLFIVVRLGFNAMMFAIHWLIFQLYLISQVFIPRQNGTYFPFHFQRTKNNGGIFPKRYQLALIYQLFIGLQMSFCRVYNYQFVKWFQKHELQNVKLALFSMRLCWYDSDAFRRICELRYRVLRRPEKCHPYLTFSSFHGFLSTKYHQGVQSQMTRTIYTTPWK